MVVIKADDIVERVLNGVFLFAGNRSVRVPNLENLVVVIVGAGGVLARRTASGGNFADTNVERQILVVTGQRPHNTVVVIRKRNVNLLDHPHFALRIILRQIIIGREIIDRKVINISIGQSRHKQRCRQC